MHEDTGNDETERATMLMFDVTLHQRKASILACLHKAAGEKDLIVICQSENENIVQLWLSNNVIEKAFGAVSLNCWHHKRILKGLAGV